MTFKRLAEFFDKLEHTASRLEMTRVLSELFKELPQSDFDKVLYLLQGRLTPLYEKKDFGLGEKLVVSAAARALQVEPKEFRRENIRLGDIGLTVEEYKKSIKSMYERPRDISYVFNRLTELAELSGAGSQDKKLSILGALIQELNSLSARYVVRIPINKLRLGFSDMTVLDAFSWMLTGDKSLRGHIEQAYQVRPDLGFIGKTLKSKGIKGLKNVKPEVFTPILMMKAERLSIAAEIIAKAPHGIIEPKYDGFRLQIHAKSLKHRTRNTKQKGEVRLFSRNLEDVTRMYPDIVEGILREVRADTIICEGEAIGYDPKRKKFLPFQETVQRRRKYNIEAKAKEIPLKLFMFELLYLNGRRYLDENFIKRRRRLEKAIKISGNISKDTILIAGEKQAQNPSVIESEFERAVSQGFEGIMIKRIDGVYKPGAREWSWIKYKRSYSSKVHDTIDCLVMGYDGGRGKRAGFGIGAILVGVHDRKNDTYKTVAKIGTGLKDNEWKEIKKKADALRVAKKPALYDVDKASEPHIWIKPKIVLEIRADEITRSPVHTAGYALRFPRLERFRDDKRADDTTSLTELKKLFELNKS